MPNTKRSSCAATVINNQAGFTLMEILAALTLTGVLLGIMAQFLYTGVALWGKNDQAYQKQHLQQKLQRKFNQDIATLITNPYLPEAAFVGNDQKISFWREHQTGLLQVTYSYDSYTKKLYRMAGFWGSTPEPQLVLEKVASCNFEYYDSKTKNWRLEWQSRTKEAIPALIKIKLKLSDGLSLPLVFSIKTWSVEVAGDD